MLRGTRKEIIKTENRIKADIDATIHNKFDIEVIDATTGKIKEKAEAYNCICDQLWPRLLNGSGYFNYIFFGKGTGTPQPSDTSLFDRLGYKSVNAAGEKWNYDFENGVVSVRRKAVIQENEYVDKTITEVGIAYGSSDSNLVTHAMLKDMNGNQISITKSNTDIINIYATLYLHYNPNGYANGAIKLEPRVFSNGYQNNPENYGPISIILGINQGAYVNEIYYSKKSHNLPQQKNEVQSSVNIQNKRKTLIANRLSAQSGNIRGISEITICNADSAGNNVWPLLFLNPSVNWVEKKRILGESLGVGDGVKKDFATKIDYPENAEVFINGIQTTCEVEKKPTGLISTNVMDYIKFYNNIGNPVLIKRDTYYYYDLYYSEYQWIENKAPANKQFFIMENPKYTDNIQFTTYTRCCKILGSDNLHNWDLLHNIDSAYQTIDFSILNYRYLKFNKHPDWHISNCGFQNIVLKNPQDFTSNVHFDTPPAQGDVITINYDTDLIAKDENHVFDLSVTLNFGEHTGD